MAHPSTSVHRTVSDVCDDNVTVSNDTPALFPLGDTAVIWNAVDDFNNSTTATQVVTIEDTTPPTIDARDDLS